MIVFINILYTCLETTNAIMLIKSNADIVSMTDNLTHMFTHLQSSYKLYTLMLNFDKISNWSKVMQTDVFKYKSCPGFYPQKIIKDYVKRANFVAICLAVLCSVVIGIYTIAGIFSKKTMYYDDYNQTKFMRKMPYRMYFPYDTNIRPFYDLTFFYQTFSIYMNAILLSGFDGVLTVHWFFTRKITFNLHFLAFCWVGYNELVPFKNLESSPVQYQEESNLRNQIKRKS